MQITLSNVAYTYADSPLPALEPITATFTAGWTGIVGPNGCGKTTLARIITAELKDYSGNIAPNPAEYPQMSCYYSAQETERPPDSLLDFALDYTKEALHIRQILGLEEDWPWRYLSLSHGERKRLQVGVSLWLKPSVLALDEPTNHVDTTTRQQLLAALAQYPGVGLLVSHDRELLDSLVSRCLFMRKGKTTMRAGSYSQGREQERLDLLSAARERKNARAELSHLRAERSRRASEAAAANVRRSKHHIASKDHSAKARIDLAIFSGQDGKAGKRSVQMDARVKAAEQRLAQAEVPKTYDGTFWLDTAPSKRQLVASLDKGTIPLSDERTLAHPQLDVGNTDHIGLQGSNGSGKSALLRALVAGVLADVPLVYLPQEIDNANAIKLLAELKELEPKQRGVLLSLVARLNSSPERILSGEALSPGELRKILLAMGIMQRPQLIIMDEPTNHLDLHSTEALEAVLAQCPCALVIVSHDAALLDATTNKRWVFTVDGRVEVKLV